MRILFTISVLFLCFLAKAQITITSADMPVAGGTFPILRDNSPLGFSIGQSGANRTWDFSNLSPDELDTTYAVAPSSTPYAGDFPNANVALTNDFSGYLFYRNTATALKAEGFANVDPNLGIVSVNFNPIPDQYRFPATYLTNFSGNSGFQEAKPYAQLPVNIQNQIDAALVNCVNPNATVSQVRVTFTSAYKDTIDAWGKVITPLGSYDALRRKRIENTHTVIEAETNCLFITQWFPIVDTTNTTTEHSWLSDITKIPLISLGYDNGHNITSVTYSATPPPPVANFTWSNPAGGMVNFTNTSQNSPAGFNWNFGDGDTSALQDPNHFYSANGSYYACLTVTNISGSDTFCDSVVVTEVDTVNHSPVAVRDSAYTISPNAIQINALGNDYDPDGDSIIYVIFANAFNGNVTRLLSGLFEYTPNNGFTGVDSFEYIIRDDRIPSLRDTGTVVIRVEGLPFANFVYTSSGFNVQFENTSTGYDHLSWDLGDGATDTASIVTHTYARGIYTVCLAANNAVGSDDTCQTVDLRNVGIKQVHDDFIQLFPNPAFKEVRLVLGNRKFQKVEIIGSEGKTLVVEPISSTTEQLVLDISFLPCGFYICKLVAADGSVSLSKLMKE